MRPPLPHHARYRHRKCGFWPGTDAYDFVDGLLKMIVTVSRSSYIASVQRLLCYAILTLTFSEKLNTFYIIYVYILHDFFFKS